LEFGDLRQHVGDFAHPDLDAWLFRIAAWSSLSWQDQTTGLLFSGIFALASLVSARVHWRAWKDDQARVNEKGPAG
jgi:hypothetical protein